MHYRETVCVLRWTRDCIAYLEVFLVDISLAMMREGFCFFLWLAFFDGATDKFKAIRPGWKQWGRDMMTQRARA